ADPAPRRCRTPDGETAAATHPYPARYRRDDGHTRQCACPTPRTGSVPTVARAGFRGWVNPPRPTTVDVITESARRRAVVIELVIVFTITLGLSGLRSLVSLLDALLRPEPLGEQSVALNTSQATVDLLDLFAQLLGVLQLLAWGALGLYLLYRAGMRLAAIGLDRTTPGRDLLGGVGLAALIGIPGLA